jgi:hypothetical protein
MNPSCEQDLNSANRQKGFCVHSQGGILRGMNTNTQKSWLRLCTGVLAAGGVALSTLGLAAGTAQAAPPPAPTYHHHWCPGDRWDQGWGNNWDWNNCHDWDDYYGGPAGYGPPPPWAPPPPPTAAAVGASTAVGALGSRPMEPRRE